MKPERLILGLILVLAIILPACSPAVSNSEVAVTPMTIVTPTTETYLKVDITYVCLNDGVASAYSDSCTTPGNHYVIEADKDFFLYWGGDDPFSSVDNKVDFVLEPDKQVQVMIYGFKCNIKSIGGPDEAVHDDHYLCKKGE